MKSRINQARDGMFVTFITVLLLSGSGCCCQRSGHKVADSKGWSIATCDLKFSPSNGNWPASRLGPSGFGTVEDSRIPSSDKMPTSPSALAVPRDVLGTKIFLGGKFPSTAYGIIGFCDGQVKFATPELYWGSSEAELKSEMLSAALTEASRIATSNHVGRVVVDIEKFDISKPSSTLTFGSWFITP